MDGAMCRHWKQMQWSTLHIPWKEIKWNTTTGSGDQDKLVLVALPTKDSFSARGTLAFQPN